MNSESRGLHPQPCAGETIVFVGGHWLGHCDREHGGWACDCDEDYVAIFNKCPECGGELDKWGECTEEEHWQ